MALSNDFERDAISRDLDSRRDERFMLHDDGDDGRSNFMALLLGGGVVAGGLLAFLYYDADGLNDRDTLTTGSIGRIEVPGTVNPPPITPATPSKPATP